MDNYYDTAQRMYDCSQLLHVNQKYHNACYMAGYVVECYAKAIVKVAQYNPRQHGHNLSLLDSQLQQILGGNTSLSSYILNGSSTFVNVFQKWNPVSLRYVSNLDELTQNDSHNFQNEILSAMQILAQMKVDGII